MFLLSNGVFSGSMFAFRGVTISSFWFQEKLSPLFWGLTQKPVAIPGMSFHHNKVWTQPSSDQNPYDMSILPVGQYGSL